MMMTQATLNKLIAMNLYGMAKAYEDQLAIAATSTLSFEERFGMLVDQEEAYRDNRRLRRLISLAKMRETACVEDINYSPSREIDKSQIASLAIGTWIQQGLDLVITGSTGSGKTWLACALGNQACRQGISVSFQRLPLLLEEMAVSHGDGSFRKCLAKLAKVDLLILDDFGLAPLTSLGRSDMLEVIESRSGKKSTLITSQLPVSRWHEYLSEGNLTVADAILDRITSGSHRLELKGESMRKLRKRKPSKN